MRWIYACFFILALSPPPHALPQAVPTARYQVPPARSDGWRTAGADSLGVDQARLAALTASVRAWPGLGVHAVLIERAVNLKPIKTVTSGTLTRMALRRTS